MDNHTVWTERFKAFILNNRFVLSLLVLLLIGLNIRVFSTIPYVFLPLAALVKTVFLPILLTGVVFYLLNPIVDILEKRGVRRVYSILILYVLIVGIIALLITIVVPFIRGQIESLLDNFPRYSRQVELQFEQFVGSGLFGQLRGTLNFNPIDYIERATGQLSKFVNNAWTSIGAVVGAVTEVILSILTVPLILFYLLKDGRRLPHYLLQFVPTRLRGQTYQVMSEMNHQISSYIRGQIIVSFCIGMLLYIGYLVIGLDYSLVLAAFAACTSVVPYLGPVIAITPALIISIVTSPFMLLKMVIVWTIVQLVEGKFISPQIMGKNMHIHPITILFVILTAGKLFGILGVILAIPGYAVLKVVFVHLFRWLKTRSRLYEPQK
ncbi:AI-2E family transporter [Paenibacillus hemerocallicola]|uniref:AI-2E family transporter n=1 Tax=Paenibacillus hemerocallicola TaxID=1172614 RepID=A0A5C4T9V8_9BACL|nr:AI-2E family transporter [Paenibacillus hemerocallicola]TNJ65207.1 AI-2E family transporter [Paenibacillus hemerocallicola]